MSKLDISGGGSNIKRILFFIGYSLISFSLLFLVFMQNMNLYARIIVPIIMLLVGIGLIYNLNEIRELNKIKDQDIKFMNKENIIIFIGSGLAAMLTWYINHNLGKGSLVASGMVGVVSALIFPANLAGAFYTASFVGMSSETIIPSAEMAALTGLIAGIVIIFSKDVYAGLGGKGGTSMAFSTQFMRIILNLFNIG